MARRENYFLLLDLDPAATAAEIEKRIRAKQDEWTSASTMGPPARRIKAKGQLEKLADIRAVLLTAESRRVEAAAAISLLEKRKADARGALESHIELLRTNPFFTDAEVASSANALKLSPADVEAAFLAAGLKKGQKRTAQNKKRPRLDGANAKAIADGLDALELKSLYEFLGMAAGAPPAALLERALELEAQGQRSGKTDANANARQLLINQCRQVFRDEAEKEKYDNDLYFLPMEKMRAVIDLAGSDGLINHAEFLLLLSGARKAGIDEKLAREYLTDYASVHGWTLITEEALGSQSEKPKSPKPENRQSDQGGGGVDAPTAGFSPKPSGEPSDAERNRGIRIAAAVVGLVVVAGFIFAIASHSSKPPGTSLPGVQVSAFAAPINYTVSPGLGAHDVNVRNGPGVTYPSAGKVAAGSSITGSGSAASSDGTTWISVSNGNGLTGFIKETLLIAQPAAVAVPTGITEAQRVSQEVQNTIFAADVAHGTPQANTSYSLPQGSSAGIYIEYANALPSDAFGSTLVKDGVVISSCPPKSVGSTNGNYWCQLGALPVGRYNLNLSINGNPINTTSFSITSPVSYQQPAVPAPGVVVAGVAQQGIPEDQQNWSAAVAVLPGFTMHENIPYGANVAKDCHYTTDDTWKFCGTVGNTVNGPIDSVRYIAQPPQPISVSYYYTPR